VDRLVDSVSIYMYDEDIKVPRYVDIQDILIRE
jgi:hypothetical protein